MLLRFFTYNNTFHIFIFFTQIRYVYFSSEKFLNHSP